MSITTSSTISNAKRDVELGYVEPVILPSTNKTKTNMQPPTPKDKIKEKIANIYMTSYTDNAWKNPQKFTIKRNTSAAAQKSAIRNYTSAAAQKSTTTSKKSLSKNSTVTKAKKTSNITTDFTPKSITQNTTLSDVEKPISTTNNYSIINYSSPVTEKSPIKLNTSTNSQKLITRSTSLTNARQAFIRKKYFIDAQKPLIKTSNTIYRRNYTSPFSQTSVNKYVIRSSTYAQTPPPINRIEIVNPQKLEAIYRTKADNANKNRMIFKIVGDFDPLRRALCDRGWIEKLDPALFPVINGLTDREVLLNAKKGNDYERVILSRMIEKYPAFFVWQHRTYRDQYLEAMPIRSYIYRPYNFDFTSKIGLIGIAEQDHWYKFSGLCGMSYPRFYRLKNSEERTEFIEDYRRTQCRNLVRFVTENISTPDKLADMKTGTILPADTLTYAIEYIEGELSDWEYLTLDKVTNNQGNKFKYDEWIEFFNSSENILRGKCKFKASTETIKEFATIAKEYLDIIYERRPDYKWDGVKNIWILKPAYSYRGNGIVIKKCLDDILNMSTDNYARNYIVQKYIERPLLIYNTKFDIRQHMIVSIGKTDASIWLYKDCYLRLSSQTFSLDDLQESIHLTNHAVQKNYQIDSRRDQQLPEYNMWSLEQFINYLKLKNVPMDIWRKKIYAGFKENLIGVVLASFEETQFVPNTFELYGCDFMLDEHYNPILIEINHTPDMYGSTPVSKRTCTMVLYDIVKVVLDAPINPNAPTGLFECVYKISYKSTFDPKDNLDVSGKAMKINQESLCTSEYAIAIPQATTSTTSVKALAVPQVSTSAKAMTDPQESTNAEALTVPQVSTSAKALTVPQENTSDKALTVPRENTSAKSLTVPQENTSTKSFTFPQENTSTKSLTVPQENTSAKSLTFPQENTSTKSLTVPQEHTSAKALTVPPESTSADALTDPQKSTNAEALTVPPESTSAKALAAPQVSNSAKALAVPQENTSAKAMPVPQISTSAKALTAPQESNSGNAMTIPQESFNNIGRNVIIHQPSLNLSIKSMAIQEQEARKEEEKNSKQKFYKKLFAKRLQLKNFLICLKSTESP